MSDALMELTNVDTASLLPSSVSTDQDLAALVGALDALWRQIAPVVPLLGVLATIDSQPAAVVDRLAHQFHVDYWDDSWPLSRKRKIVKDAIRLHRIAGTRGAVEDIITAIWGDAAILTEWWQYGGEPGTFEVALIDQTPEAVTAFVNSIRKVKRATDHLTISIVNDVGPSTVHAGAVYHQYTAYRL